MGRKPQTEEPPEKAPRKKPGRYGFEHHGQHPLSPAEFRDRLVNFTLLAIGVILTALFIGMCGYRFFENLPWLDAFLNAAMILSGMGPVDRVESPGGKIFAGTYAILSGVVFLATASILFAPVFHRLLHKFHFDERDVEEDPKD